MRVAFVLPFFGHFDNLFPLWLETCRYNKGFDWLLFTDDHRFFNYPDNVKVFYMEFSMLQERIQQICDFPISLSHPYRLCNFKPAYGLIFQDYLKGYDAWGFCDNDMLYGDLNHAIPGLKTLEKCKIGEFGHLSILPNSHEGRTIFKYADAYKIAFSTPEPLFFDENAFPLILKKNGYETKRLHIADFKPRIWTHEVLNEPGREWMNKAHCFVWYKGNLLRYYVDKSGKVAKEEYDYIHFLKRPMEVDHDVDTNRPIVIVPNRIFNMELTDITVDFLVRVGKCHIFWNYWKNSLKPRNFMDRVKKRLYQRRINKSLMAQMNAFVLKNENIIYS